MHRSAPQYQVRLHLVDGSLIYAPRDENCYIRPNTPLPMTIASSRRLSQERRLLQTLEASLDGRSDGRKQKMYEKLRTQHRKAMQLIINDVAVGGCVSQ